MGYDIHTKAYRLFNFETRKVILNHDVMFDKTHIEPLGSIQITPIHGVGVSFLEHSTTLKKERTKELGNVQHLNNIGSISKMSQRPTKKSSQGGTLSYKSLDTSNEPPTNCEHLVERIEPVNDGINLDNDQGSMFTNQTEIP